MRTKSPALHPQRRGGSASCMGRVGSSSIAAVLGLLGLLLCLLGALAWYWLRPTAVPLGTGARALTTPPAPQLELKPAAAEVQRDEDIHAAPRREMVFVGKGSIRGRVVTPAGVPLPEKLQVIVEPALLTEGREHAIQRTIELSGADPEFALEDLPQAGYRIYARAAGMNSRYTEIALVQSSNKVYKVLELRPAGSLEGAVRTESGELAVDLLVVMDDLVTRERYETRTDLRGVWRFEGVRDSKYRMSFGHAERPLIRAEELDFKGLHLSYPERVIPDTASLILRIVDEQSRPLEDARIRGFGAAAVPFDLQSGPNGIARVSYLLPGSYQIAVSHGPERRAETTLRVEGKERDRIYQIICRSAADDAARR